MPIFQIFEDKKFSAGKWLRPTGLLYWFFTQVRRLRDEGLKSRIKAFIKKALRKINYELMLRPALRKSLLRWSYKLGLYERLKLLLAKAQGRPQWGFASVQGFENSIQDFRGLSPRARQIYYNLKTVIEQQKGER